MEGVGHLHGWQWLFLVEGLMTVVMGVYLAMALASNPSKVLKPLVSLPVCLSMSPSPCRVSLTCTALTGLHICSLHCVLISLARHIFAMRRWHTRLTFAYAGILT